ncbi:MAG: hypothetical protein PHZ09_01370 [Eubacteriales bacterium]|jgi:hypothetical protein|nr:hypothetical protein [Eubacteriales bacterium]
MDRSKLLIGAYYYDKCLYDDARMKELADAGIQFIVGVPADDELLDLCEKYNIKIITTSHFPLWWGGTGETGGTYHEKMTIPMMDQIAASYKHHPAIWGDYPVDEPNSKDYDHIGRVLDHYSELLPGRLPFINLHPYYEDVRCTKWLGNPYREYLQLYLDKINNDYIAFDIYPFSNKMYFDTYLYGLDIIADACRRSNRDMWVIIQSGAWKSDQILKEHQIRWQCALALAYGTRVIMHASYSPGWWDETTSCVNKSGTKNVTYDYVKTVNEELHSLSDIFMRYKNAGVYPCGNPDGTDAAIAEQLRELERINRELYAFDGIPASKGIVSDNAALLCGCFTDDNGGEALMLVNMKGPNDETSSSDVDLSFDGRTADFYIKGKKTDVSAENGVYKLRLESGGAAFIKIN